MWRLSVDREITGTEDKIEGMIELLRPLGIVEMVRTGQVSMTRGVNDGVRRVSGVNGNRSLKICMNWRKWRRSQSLTVEGGRRTPEQSNVSLKCYFVYGLFRPYSK